MLQVQRSGLVAARGIEAPFIQCFHSGLTLFFLLSLRVRKIYAVCKGCRSVHRNVHTWKIVFHSHHSYLIQFRNLCVS